MSYSDKKLLGREGGKWKRDDTAHLVVSIAKM